MRVEKPREIAAQVLSRHAASGQWLDELLAEQCDRAGLAGPDRALACELVLGSTRQQALLDWMIARRTDDREQPVVLRTLLRLGLYQLFVLDRIPDHAAVHETVELARNLGFAAQAGFVNALLRGALRERDQLEREWADLKERRVDLAYSHPRWLCERWEKQFGPEQLRSLLTWNNQTPPVYARANTLKFSPDEFRRRLQADGAQWAPVSFDWVPDDWMVKLVEHPSISAMPSFRAGAFYVQDPSTLLAVRELDAGPGETVLDLCAAPGGKTTALAQVMRNEGRITAFDPEASRRRLIRENCDRLGVSIVRVPEGRAARPGEQFDRVLIDAPCSNTGVMRRRAELRWRITEAEIQRLRRLQLDIVRQGLALLRPGGTLIYSTCSLERDENESVVEEILAEAPSWKLVRQRQVSPLTDGVDGAYVAVLQMAPAQFRSCFSENCR